MTGAVLTRPAVGPIEPHVLYPLEDLQARSGMGKTALRSARRAGLRVRYAGNRAFVLGSDFIKWLDENARDEK